MSPEESEEFYSNSKPQQGDKRDGDEGGEEYEEIVVRVWGKKTKGRDAGMEGSGLEKDEGVGERR